MPTHNIKSKDKVEDIRNLVFQGGSVKGVAYTGAYEGLVDAGLNFALV